jgi:hypothetical protein
MHERTRSTYENLPEERRTQGDIKVDRIVILKWTVHTVISSQVLFHNGSLLHSKFNTQLLITVHNSSGILTHDTYPGSVIQLLTTTLKTRPTAS